MLAVGGEAAQLAAHQRCEAFAEVHGARGRLSCEREVLALLLGDAGEAAAQRFVVEGADRDVEALEVELVLRGELAVFGLAVVGRVASVSVSAASASGSSVSTASASSLVLVGLMTGQLRASGAVT